MPVQTFSRPLLCLMPSAAQSPACYDPLSSSSTIVSAVPSPVFPSSVSEMTSLTIMLPRGYTQGIQSISVTPTSPHQSRVTYSITPGTGPKTPSGLRKAIYENMGTNYPSSALRKKQESKRVSFVLKQTDSPQSEEPVAGHVKVSLFVNRLALSWDDRLTMRLSCLRWLFRALLGLEDHVYSLPSQLNRRLYLYQQ
jgi:hypothetical protein